MIQHLRPDCNETIIVDLLEIGMRIIWQRVPLFLSPLGYEARGVLSNMSVKWFFFLTKTI